MEVADAHEKIERHRNTSDDLSRPGDAWGVAQNVSVARAARGPCRRATWFDGRDRFGAAIATGGGGQIQFADFCNFPHSGFLGLGCAAGQGSAGGWVLAAIVPGALPTRVNAARAAVIAAEGGLGFRVLGGNCFAHFTSALVVRFFFGSSFFDRIFKAFEKAWSNSLRESWGL